jgi:hypothetical protein
MIIKENDKYILRTPEGDRILAWIKQGGSVETTKVWEGGQIFQYKAVGCIALNKDLLLFLKSENIDSIVVNYVKSGKWGKVFVDINIWLEKGVEEHNDTKPYDNQLILPSRFIAAWGDEITKQILKEIWDEKDKGWEQREQLTKLNPQGKL